MSAVSQPEVQLVRRTRASTPCYIYRVLVLELCVDGTETEDAESGGLFVPGAVAEPFTSCELLIKGATEQLRVLCEVVMRSDQGVAVQFCDRSPAQRQLICEFIARSVDAAPEGPKASSGQAQNHAIRHLSHAEQVKRALVADLPERMLLERTYGKMVWEPLLRNPRISGQEVARLARLGTLPRPLLEQICSNAAWLGIPEVRRALLGNPRLAVDQIGKILRLLPKHELKLAPTQTTYASSVRDAARRLLKDGLA